MALFGTDGVRGVFGEDLTTDLARDLAIAAAHVLAERGEFQGHRPFAIVGQDSRASGQALEKAISEGLSSAGVDVYQVGIVPTPAVAYLVSARGADLGVMISASHNPASDNGIKFFARDGGKLDDSLEEKIEALVGVVIDSSTESNSSNLGIGSVVVDESARETYIEFLLSTIGGALTINHKKLKVVVDCANGAASFVAPDVYRRAGAEVVSIHAEPNGRNINDGCGSTHMESLVAKVREVRADLGIAHDGDADRALFVDANGDVIDGDQVLAILAVDMGGRLANRRVVGTVMSNLGFVNAMTERGIEVVKTAVGDRYVLERMVAEGLNLGGEQSGHVIMRDFANTGDGVLTALHLMAVMARSGKSAAELASVVTRYPQVLVNVRGVDKARLDGHVGIGAKVAEFEARLGERGRILLRASGTEPLVRVMVEAFEKGVAEEIAAALADLVSAELGI
jgi:phosphoglucosamine mutase